MNIRRRLSFALILLMTMTAFSVAGYRLLGGPRVSFLDALYMAVITLAGVGYGEIVETVGHPALRIFNMFIVLVGVCITAFVFSVLTAFLVEGELNDIFRRRKMERRISELKNHYVICGLGDTGRHAVEEMQKTLTPYVVIESHEDHIKKFKEQSGASFNDMLYVIGDATDEAVLDAAGVERAKGMISSLPTDKDNLVIAVMVRQKSATIRIVARCIDQKYADRILKAGANATVSPNRIGGLRMASEALRPHVVGFLDLMLKEQSRTLRIEEIELSGHSPWSGARLDTLHIRKRFNLNTLAVKDPAVADGFLPNPPDDLRLTNESVLVVMGAVDDVKRAREEASGKSRFSIAKA